MNIIPYERRQRQGKSEIVFKLVELALARGRDITFGSSDPAQYYHELRKRFPDAIIVVEQFEIKILGKRNARYTT